MAFIKKVEFSKKVQSILTKVEAKRIGVYTLPQFGVGSGNPLDGKPKAEKYTDDEAAEAIQEAVDYCGADNIVRFLNWAIVVKAQRMSNNDLRTASAGLDKASQARVTLLMNMAKRQAEAEVGDYDEKGELVIDRKSTAYLDAMRESLESNLKKAKFSDLKKNFEAVDGGEVYFDLTAPGSLFKDDDDDAKVETEEETATA